MFDCLFHWPFVDVPWALVNGELLEQTSTLGLTRAICSAYTGTPPASCSFAVEKTVEPCFNK